MGGAYPKPEYPPLFPAGFHVMTLAEVLQRLVDDFSTSKTRRAVFSGFLDVVVKLNASGIVGKLWLGGSFLTEKIDPEDVDYVLCVSSGDYDHDPKKRAIADWAVDDARWTDNSCDAYLLVEYSAGHPRAAYTRDRRAYWIDTFGRAFVSKKEKGIVVVHLPAVIP